MSAASLNYLWAQPRALDWALTAGIHSVVIGSYAFLWTASGVDPWCILVGYILAFTLIGPAINYLIGEAWLACAGIPIGVEMYLIKRDGRWINHLRNSCLPRLLADNREVANLRNYVRRQIGEDELQLISWVHSTGNSVHRRSHIHNPLWMVAMGYRLVSRDVGLKIRFEWAICRWVYFFGPLVLGRRVPSLGRHALENYRHLWVYAAR